MIAAGEDFLAEEIFERDQYHCWLCGQPTAGQWPAPWSPSVDHVVPIARGGRHTRENVRTAHLICNIKKAAR